MVGSYVGGCVFFRGIVIALCCVLSISKVNACPQQPNADIIGEATDLKSKQFLYCEYHFLSDKQSIVIYRNSNSEKIAEKTVNYLRSNLAPDIQQTDFRHCESIVVTQSQPLAGSSVSDSVLAYRVSYRKANSDDVKVKTIRSKPPMKTIVDAGFDNAIRYYWNDLQSTGSATFSFLVPARLKTVTLKVVKMAMEQCESLADLDKRYAHDEHDCYRVYPKSAVLRLFVSPLTLVYQIDNQQLMFFSGNSNITNDNGKGQKVAINYRYQ